jgi:hypothetical protein
VSALLFAAALFFPVYRLSDGGSYGGFMVLALGWMAPFTDNGPAGWYANPFLWLAWLGLALSRWRAMAVIAAVAAAIALAIALTSSHATTLLINEAGATADVIGRGPGLYLWVASIGAAFAGAIATTAVAFGKQ